MGVKFMWVKYPCDFRFFLREILSILWKKTQQLLSEANVKMKKKKYLPESVILVTQNSGKKRI